MSEPFKRAEEVFHAVAEAPAERRESLLAELCKEDTELRALVQRLIAHDREGMPGFLRPPTRSTETIVPPTRSARPDFKVGPYQVLDVIAQGGMGTVYVAHQSKPVERDVALKVIRADIDSRNVIARFEAERQALALMDHPNIAKVLDAGETEQGQPYFVMELIRGLPITEYCDRGRLTTRARLELFRPVCEAVQHAHQKAIIHRDLKPSNVLVAEVDGRPLPKVIDFGVAKATAMRLTQRPMHTAFGTLVGTLEYMSPEQASLSSEDVDTRSDVYSLGVILYELLVGELPFAPRDPHGARYEEVRRRILEEDPQRPSTRISTLDSRSVDRAKGRGTDVHSLRRQLMGDLDWIIVKTLEKDRARRYATPMHLAADIQRHLRDEPVEARPPSASYRARKFIRRHRVGVATAALVTLALVAAIVGTAAGLVRARRAESVARTEQQRSEKAATFLANTLSGINPAGIGETLALTLRDRIARQGSTARSLAANSETPAPYASFEGVNLIDVTRSLVDEQLLGKAVHRLESELRQDPALAADLYHAIGIAYNNLQLFTPAVECSERAVELSERARGRDHATTNNMRVLLAGTYGGMGRYRDAERVYLEAIESLRGTLGEGARETLMAQASLGWNYQQEGQANSTTGDSKKTDEAERLLRKTLERMRSVLGEDDRYTLWTAHGLGLALVNQRRFGEAEPLLRDVVERMSRVLGGASADTINATLSLAAVVFYSGRPEEAEKMALELLERSRRVVGDDSFLVLLIETKLGVVYLDQGRLDEAEGFLRNCAAKLPRVLGEESQFTKEAIAALARLEGLRSTRRPR